MESLNEHENIFSVYTIAIKGARQQNWHVTLRGGGGGSGFPYETVSGCSSSRLGV